MNVKGKNVFIFVNKVTKKGKNYYVESDGCRITVNASSFTIITAHKK